MQPDLDASIDDGNRQLALDGYAPRLKLEAQRILVNLLEKTRAELAMDSDGGADDRFAQGLMFESHSPSTPLLGSLFPGFLVCLLLGHERRRARREKRGT